MGQNGTNVLLLIVGAAGLFLVLRNVAAARTVVPPGKASGTAPLSTGPVLVNF